MNLISKFTTLILYILIISCNDRLDTNGLTKYQNIDSLTVFAPELSIKDNTFKGSFSDDFNTFYFFRKIASGEEKYIPFTSTFINGSWSEATIADYYDENQTYTYQLKVPGTDKLVFTSDIRTKADTSSQPNYNFWLTKQEGGAFTSPEELGPISLIQNYNSQPSISSKGTIYFTSDTPDWSNTYAYQMRLDGDTYMEPELFEPVNTWRENKDWTVYEFTMSPNEDYLIVCIQAKSENGVLNTDLYISYQENGSWTIPERLNNGLSTPETENFPYITSDSKYLVFTRAFSEFYIIPTEQFLK